MKNNYIKYFIILILISYNINISFAIENCSDKNGYDLYECRKKYICKKEYGVDPKNQKNLNIVYGSTKLYKKIVLGDGLDDAKKTYRENQNNIYKCGILKVQEDSLILIKDKLLIQDKTGSIKNKINQKIKKKIKNIDNEMNNIGCKNTKTTTIQNKFNILNQSIYELCNYHSYLEYLKQYDSNIENILFPKINNSLPNNVKKSINNKQYSIKDVSNIMTNIQNNIDNEINNSYNIFPLAYNAYTEYENNYIIHVLLDLIREDYIILRNKLYSTLNPISQFVYKLANAMKMP